MNPRLETCRRNNSLLQRSSIITQLVIQAPDVITFEAAVLIVHLLNGWRGTLELMSLRRHAETYHNTPLLSTLAEDERSWKHWFPRKFICHQCHWKKWRDYDKRKIMYDRVLLMKVQAVTGNNAWKAFLTVEVKLNNGWAKSFLIYYSCAATQRMPVFAEEVFFRQQTQILQNWGVSRCEVNTMAMRCKSWRQMGNHNN